MLFRPLLTDLLYLVEQFPAYDGLMVVLNIIPVLLALVLDPLLGYWIDGICGAHHKIPLVFNILEDPEDVLRLPVRFAILLESALLLKFSGDHVAAGTFFVSAEDISDDGSLTLVHTYALRSRIIVIAKASVESDKFSSLHLHLKTFLDIGRDIFYLLLSNRTEYSE